MARRTRRWQRVFGGLLTAVVLICAMASNGKETAFAGTNSNIRIESDLSVYSSNVKIAWDVPANLSPAEYVIYVDGCERYRSKTNQYMFTDLAPDTSYAITVRPLDAMGFLYDEIGSVTIKTGYSRRLIVSTTSLSEAALSALGASASYTDIQTAVNAAKPGDAIVVRNGYYSGYIRIQAKHSGTANQWITLKAENDEAWLFGHIKLEASYYRIDGLNEYMIREVAGENELRPNEIGYDIKEYEKQKYLMFDATTGKTGISVTGNDT